MHGKIDTITFWGIETIAVMVQIYIANDLHVIVVIGLTDKAAA